MNSACHPEERSDEGSVLMNTYCVYLMANQSKTLYVGVTNDLKRRVYEHKNKLIDGFTKKYNLTKLVHFEETSDINAAILREKQIKGWLRSKKIQLIEMSNPLWKDLSLAVFEDDFDKENPRTVDSSAFGLRMTKEVV